MRVREMDGSKIRRLDGGPDHPEEIVEPFGDVTRPTEYRIIDYSEITHDNFTGQIDFLKGSTIDEAIFNIILKPNLPNDFENLTPDEQCAAERTRHQQAYQIRHELVELEHRQYLWQPRDGNGTGDIVGYRKEVDLIFQDSDAAVITIRVLGLLRENKGIAASKRIPLKASVVASVDAMRQTTVNVSTYALFASDYVVQRDTTPSFANPTEIKITSGNVAADNLGSSPEAMYYYRARANHNNAPWSEVASVPVASA